VAAESSEAAWKQLTQLESLHREVQRSHERLLRDLDQASTRTDRSHLHTVWNQYRDVVAELSRVTEELESLRLLMG
jgi:hypothetical protein